jgi:hypothetical protein
LPFKQIRENPIRVAVVGAKSRDQMELLHDRTNLEIVAVALHTTDIEELCRLHTPQAVVVWFTGSHQDGLLMMHLLRNQCPETAAIVVALESGQKSLSVPGLPGIVRTAVKEHSAHRRIGYLL